MSENIEKSPERIPTKDEVMEVVFRSGASREKIVTVRELHDDDASLRFLELKVEGEKPGETTEYLYTRRGMLQSGDMETSLSSIEAFYYQDGKIVSGARIAEYNSETGEWKEVK